MASGTSTNPFEIVRDTEGLGDTTTEPEFVDFDGGTVDAGTQEASGEGAEGSLAEAAQSAFGEDMGELGTVQETLPGTDYLKIRFVGISKDYIEKQNMMLGDRHVFLVEGIVSGKGVDVSKVDGHEKHFVKVDVDSVKLQK